METKELNVSEKINFNAVESTAGVAPGAATPSPTELAQTIVAAMQNAQQVARQQQIEEANEAKRKNDEYLKANMPVAEIFEVKGRPYVYLPFDLREDFSNWDCDYGIYNYDHVRTSEFEYILSPLNFNTLKQRYSLKAIDLYRKINAFEEYLAQTDKDDPLAPRINSEIPKVINGLKALYRPLEEAATTATDKSEYTFDELAVILSSPGILLAVNVNEGDKLALMTKSADISNGFFGTYISAKGEFHTCNPSVRKVEHAFYISAFPGKKALGELGINPVGSNEELQKYLKERGTSYIQITSKPSYLAYKGDLYRRSWRSSTAFRATGRIMVDFDRMTEMDPNYDYYLGGTADRYEERFKGVQNIEVTDDVLMTMSPYVYGFSFLSKVWGEFAVDKISEIKYREDAYDKLVMDEDQKEMILSLVETQLEGKRADIIDGKGGGCIFLLAGEPGK